MKLNVRMKAETASVELARDMWGEGIFMTGGQLNSADYSAVRRVVVTRDGG
jgi:hypothetical protein